MSTIIKLKRKFSAGAPALGDLAEGEVAVNTVDKRIYMRDASNQVVTVAESGASVVISETAPAGAAVGDMWFDSSDNAGRIKVYYNDGDSTQWIDATPISSIPEAVMVQEDGGDYIIHEDNSFISYEQATNDIHLNPVLPFVTVQNDTAFLATIDANPSATADIDVTLPTISGTLQTEDDVIGLIMAMG